MRNPFNLIGQKRPVGPAEIERRLGEAEAAIPDLERRHRAHLFDVEQGADGAAAVLTDVATELGQTHQRVRNLREALIEATARQEAQERAQREAVEDAQLASVRQHLSYRDRAAEAFGQALAQAIEQWQELVRHSDAAMVACPVGFAWPAGGLSGPTEIARAVTHELYRLDGDPSRRQWGTSFPGACATGADTLNNPEAIKPLPDQMKQGSAYIVRNLVEQIAAKRAR